MSSTKSIKQRIKSVKNTSQITKAMEVVSATKMRRSQEFALRARPFAVAALEMVHNLLNRTPSLPPFFHVRPIATSSLLVVTSDKGLAGSLNANVLKKAEAYIKEREALGTQLKIFTVGKKAKDYLERRGYGVHKSFWGFGDYTTPEETLPVARELIDGFAAGAWDEVIAIYTHFRTTLLQEVVVKKILPATAEGLTHAVQSILPERGKFSATETDKPHVSGPEYTYEYKFEPSLEAVLNDLVPMLIRVHLHHVILESNASEHSARMVAMKNASDNARELIQDLTLAYNKARQAGITRELTEITAGKEALEG